MTLYPAVLDTDTELPRVDDDLSDFEARHINTLREAIFALQRTLGVNVQGSLNSVAERLAVFFGENGQPKAASLESLGLAPLPIHDKHIAVNAGIKESKLSLSYSTSSLYTLVVTNATNISSLLTSQSKLLTDFDLHLQGSQFLMDGVTLSRHSAAQVDMVQVLIDYMGDTLASGTVEQAIHSLNQTLIDHQNATANVHPASAIVVDTENFEVIPQTSTTVQQVFNYLDQNEVLNMGQHRAVQHAAGVTSIQRSQAFNSSVHLGNNVVPATTAITYLVHNPNASPVDNLSIGDDLIQFTPNNDTFAFDGQFSQVKPGDVVTVNYGNGVETSFLVDSIRFTPGSEWMIRINGCNLYDVAQAAVRIDRPNADLDSQAILAVAPVNIWDDDGPVYTDILTSVTIADPKAASVLGLDFDAGQLNSTHYKLYLEFYPTGVPSEKKLSLPFIDVTGNAGATPGLYSLQSVVQTVNNQFRRLGYNYRFMAFAYKGQFGLCLADAIDNASFAVIRGDNSSGTLQVGIYTENVLGGNDLDSFDALGFGPSGANVASPAFQESWPDASAALSPTKVISPKKYRYYYVNGLKRDSFAPTYLADEFGFWDGYISARVPIGNFNVEVTYTVALDLRSAGLKPGKTLVIQPKVSFEDSLYNDVDYGRFIIKDVNFDNCSGSFNDKTLITVVNGIHAIGQAFASSSGPDLPVKIHFGYDSVGFNNQNIIDTANSSDNYARWYEVYINDRGQTFSHERLRFIKQVETNTLLDSSRWHLLNVSSKLRGYQGSNPAIFNKFLRFFVRNYDSTTGEYDGYVGKISGSGVTLVGPTIHSKKNIATKFYDETGIDYVELIYKDSSSTPGSNIASSTAARYFDFELFPSLQNQDELLLLSGCEVVWAPPVGQNLVDYIIDLRQFGSIDASDLNDSAKEYLSAPERYLHQNGVLFGLDLDSISSIPNSGEVYFKGGLVLVDGHVTPVNQSSITIPRVYPQGSSLPQSVVWCVCVTKDGNLTSLIITSSTQQYFATTGTDHYLLPSTTFSDLIHLRRDLVPIRLLTSTVSSLTISSTVDIRKFIVMQDVTADVVWSGDSSIIGNFYALAALKEWVNRSNGTYQVVKLRGEFTLSATDSPFDLTGFTKNVIFDGENAVFRIAAPVGFTLGSNVTLRNLTIYYSGANAIYTSGRLLNVDENKSCITNVAGQSLNDLKIQNCSFYHESDGQRPPFIFFALNKGTILKNIQIVENKFYDVGESYLTQSQAAIAFWTTNSGGSSYPAVVYNLTIKDNYCNQSQGIYVTTKGGTTGAEIPGLNAVGCRIASNLCGIIGFVTSNVINTNPSLDFQGPISGLDIVDNTCSIIGNFYDYGDFILDPESDDISYGSGNVLVRNNRCHWICLQSLNKASLYRYSSLQIQQNILTAFDSTYLSIFTSEPSNYAITVTDLSSAESTFCHILNNNIQFGRVNSISYTYSGGISSDASSVISGNIIQGLGASAVGISALGTGGSGTKRYNIHQNQIYRGSSSISSYIRFPNAGTQVIAECTENFFDSPTVDGSSIATIAGNLDQVVAERNINQTATLSVSVAAGQWGAGTSTPLLFGDGYIANVTRTNGMAIFQNSDFTASIRYSNDIATNDRYPAWLLQLDEVLPKNTYVTSVSVTLLPSTDFTFMEFDVSLSGNGLTTLFQSGISPAPILMGGTTLEITVPNRSFIVNPTIRPIVKLNGDIENDGGGFIDLTSFIIKYRW